MFKLISLNVLERTYFFNNNNKPVSMNDHSIFNLITSKLLKRDKIASSVIVYIHLHYYYSNITADTVSVSIPTPHESLEIILLAHPSLEPDILFYTIKQNVRFMV